MSEPSNVQEILNQAEERERGYDWSGAVEFYTKALGLMTEQDSLGTGEIYERLGYGLYRAAFQAESTDEFGEKMRQAAATYEKTKECYDRLKESVRTPRMSRSDAMIAFISYWLATEAREKKRLIDECWKLATEALKAFDGAGDMLEYGKTFNQLSKSADFSFCLEWDWQARDRIMKEAISHGEQAIESLSTLQDHSELARAYAKTADYLETFGYAFLNRDEQERQFEKARSYWKKAGELSEEAAVLESLSILEGLTLEFGAGTDETIRFYQRALEYGRKTKDNFIVGCALDLLAYHTAWSTGMTEDPEETYKQAEKALQYAAEAKNQYAKVSFVGPGYGFLWVEAPNPEFYCNCSFLETDLGKRRDLLKKAAEAVPDLLEAAENSGYPDAVWYAHHVFGKILTATARIETSTESKRRLLEKALERWNESVRVIEQIAPSMYWERGVFQGGISVIKSELADLALDPNAKRKTLLEAVADREKSVKLLANGIVEKGGSGAFLANLGYTQYLQGLLLNRAYESTNNKEYPARATEAFEEASRYYGKLDLMSRVAECHWKAAQTYNALGEHLKAAESFDLASNDYRGAAERTHQLRDFYLDHSVYMQAWSEIEKARHHHERQEYGSAKEHFEKAADLHKSLKQWSYLEPNYSAWAQVENAEELSRKEQSEEATKAFEQAAKLFSESKKSLQTQLNKIEDTDEKQMTIGMIKVSDLRREYCDARIALEEAKILDKKGNHFASSGKYGSAAETFEKISRALSSDQERREFKLVVILSRAWQKMTLAESEASPTLYAEASQLFEQAKDFSQNDQTKMLALGHSRFCNALEAGTRFADTRDATMHANATKYLESAANYYVKAGFPKASEYAEATELLLDAYAHMDSAKEEKDPEKKAKLYKMAETVLQTSAGSFMRAEHPEKREQVLGLLEKVKKERELALSLAEVLHAPSVVSTTTSFATPTPTSEKAVGSERFEHADIQANITTRQKELKVGETLNLELELVNAGKSSALLIKVTEIIPKDFEVAEQPGNMRIEDHCLNMKGRRLDPLKTEEVRIVLRPKVQGIFQLTPKILYLDENGKYKSHEPEPISITVKELGIKGWLKGER